MVSDSRATLSSGSSLGSTLMLSGFGGSALVSTTVAGAAPGVGSAYHSLWDQELGRWEGEGGRAATRDTV
jgi:hypothetical protein